MLGSSERPYWMRRITTILIVALFSLALTVPSQPPGAGQAALPFTGTGFTILHPDTSPIPAKSNRQIATQKPVRETRLEQIEKGEAVPADIDDEDIFDSMKPESERQGISSPPLFSHWPVDAAQSGSALTLHEMRKEIGDLSPPTVGLTKSPPTLTPNSQTTTAHVFNTKILPPSTTDISIHPASQPRPTIVVYKGARTLVMPLGSFIEGAR